MYNIGGGRGNSLSILECIDAVERLTGKKFSWEYVEANRLGDHICYVSDLRKLQSHYPKWSITRDIPSIWEEMLSGASPAPRAR
jgi:CDP-paratose 2-epimerase